MPQVESPCRPAAFRLGADHRPQRITHALGRIRAGWSRSDGQGSNFMFPLLCKQACSDSNDIGLTDSKASFPWMAFASSFRGAYAGGSRDSCREGHVLSFPVITNVRSTSCLLTQAAVSAWGLVEETMEPGRCILHPAFQGCFCSPHPCAVGISWRSNAGRVHNASHIRRGWLTRSTG
jgi:hypothetical protein